LIQIIKEEVYVSSLCAVNVQKRPIAPMISQKSFLFQKKLNIMKSESQQKTPKFHLLVLIGHAKTFTIVLFSARVSPIYEILCFLFGGHVIRVQFRVVVFLS